MSVLGKLVQLVGTERVTRALGLPPAAVERVRSMWGGQLAPPPVSVVEWYQDDIDAAIRAADTGDLRIAGQLCRSLRRDGMVHGLLRARTGGLVRLPKRFSGNADMVSALEGPNKKVGRFARMFPSRELAQLAADGVLLGVGVAEMRPVEGADYKVMRRLDPQWLRYRWNEGRFYYNSIAGPLPITPGDGTWILHLAGGEVEPWNSGGWAALGKAFISKDHAFMHEEAYGAKLAHPARVARTAPGATDQQRLGFLDQLISWGINTVIEMPPGWMVDIVESKGTGFEVFDQTARKRDEQIVMVLAGNKALVDGGSGFSNLDIHAAIRADIIQEDAEALAHTINTQGIPPWVNDNYGGDALDEAPILEWDVTPPTDLKAEAEAQKAAAEAIEAWNRLTGKRVNVAQAAVRYRMPIIGDLDGDGTPDEEVRDAELVDQGEGDDALVVETGDDQSPEETA